MFMKHRIPDTLIGSDFSEHERKAFLHTVSSYEPDPYSAPYTPRCSKGSEMNEAIAPAGRSVPGELEKRSILRTAWWKVNYFIPRLIKLVSASKQRMHGFCSRQQPLTRFDYQTVCSDSAIYAAIRQEGCIAGLRCALTRVKRPVEELQ